MNRTYPKKTAAILGILLCASGAATAQDRKRPREMFQQLDINGNRQIEFSEIQAERGKLFDRLDTNRNGILDPNEVEAAKEKIQAGHEGAPRAQLADVQERKAEMDKNHDGKISRDEFSSFIPERVIKADANGDRALSLFELRSLRRQ